MNLVNYKITTLKENGDDFTEISQQTGEASLVEFFFGELGSVWFGLVPPLYALNYFLAHGGYGAPDPKQRGIHYTYEWSPLEVTPDQYPEIVYALRQLPYRPFEEIAPPSDVQTVPEYEHWSFVRYMDKKHEDYQRQKSDA